MISQTCQGENINCTIMSTTQDIVSPISDYYAGRSIFITGGTGFMGKVLLEKLLRSCPGINKIYVLIRTKKGQLPQDRLQAMLKGRLFLPLTSRLQAYQASTVLSKVVAVAGDITEPNLGISMADEQMLVNDVSVIFHAAATVKFDDDLADSIKMNVKGTLSIVDLARKVHSLSSLVHVSTAFEDHRNAVYDAQTRGKYGIQASPSTETENERQK